MDLSMLCTIGAWFTTNLQNHLLLIDWDLNSQNVMQQINHWQVKQWKRHQCNLTQTLYHIQQEETYTLYVCSSLPTIGACYTNMQVFALCLDSCLRNQDACCLRIDRIWKQFYSRSWWVKKCCPLALMGFRNTRYTLLDFTTCLIVVTHYLLLWRSFGRQYHQRLLRKGIFPKPLSLYMCYVCVFVSCKLRIA